MKILPKVAFAAAFFAAVASAQYCIPPSTAANCANGDEYLSNVTFGAVSVTQGCPAPGTWYQNYSSGGPAPLPAVAIVPGTNLAVTYTVSNFWSSDRVHFFLDADNNGAFDLPAEKLLVHVPPAAGTYNVNVPIPATVPSGTNLRLRVRLTYGTPAVNNEACASMGYSHAMDFDALAPNLQVPDYQVNSANASLDFNGVQGNIYLPATTNVCVNSPIIANLGGTAIGFPFDVILSASPLIPTSAGALQTAGGQVLNINLTQFFTFVFGGTFTNGFVPFSLPASFPSPASFKLQMAIIDPTVVGAIALSQGCNLDVSGAQALIPGPFVDDAGTIYTANDPLTGCLPALNFFGTTYTQFSVESNGRVGFSPAAATVPFGTGSWVPGVAGGNPLTDTFAGFWMDFQGGSFGVAGNQINLQNLGNGLLQIDYVNQNYWGQPALIANGSIIFDAATSTVTLSKTGTWPSDPTTPCWLGLSPGQAGSAAGIATDSGQQVYATGGTGGAISNPTDMIYTNGDPGAVWGTATTIVYTFNAVSSTYTWAGF